MRNVLLAMLALFALTATPMVYAEDLPDVQSDVQSDDGSAALPPLTDSTDAN